MKKLMFITMLVVFPVNVQAKTFQEEFVGKEFRPVIQSQYRVEYTTANKLTLAGAILTAILDTASTMQALKKPGVEELNPLLGKNPGIGRILLVKAAVGTLVFLAVEYWIPEGQREVARNVVWGTATVVQGAASISNFNLGS